MKILIFGANGFLGRALTRYFLARGEEVVAIARREEGCLSGAKVCLWDGLTIGAWCEELSGADALINLAGRTVNCRYSDKHKEEIMQSRVLTTALIRHAVTMAEHPPKVWINSSTATIYEHREWGEGRAPHTEEEGVVGEDFSMGVAKAWEQEFFKEEPTRTLPSVRKVAARTAIVLGAERGTVFQVLSNLTRFGLGGAMGGGNQMVSWIHEYDFCRAMEFLIKTPNVKGAVNIVSPQAERNRVLMKKIRDVWKVPVGLPATRLMIKVGAFLLRSESELVLKSRWVYPDKLLKAGFLFVEPELQRALKELHSRSISDKSYDERS